MMNEEIKSDMFTTPCFIRKNTPKLREKLEELGYNHHGDYRKWEDYVITFLASDDGKPYYISATEEIVKEFYYYCIDCSENEALFLAIAALRDDSDYMQWFTCKVRDSKGNPLPDSWVLCTQKTLLDFGWVNNSPNSYGENTPYHKATPEELQEHFK